MSRPWLTQLAQRTISLLSPIYDAQFASIRASRVKAMDETPIKAGRAGRGKMKTGYFWPVYGEADEVCFAYCTSRAHAHVRNLLGMAPAPDAVLISDGYDAYRAYAAKTGLTHAQCWAHARREIFEALESEPAGVTQALEQIKAMLIPNAGALMTDGQYADFILQRHEPIQLKPPATQLEKQYMTDVANAPTKYSRTDLHGHDAPKCRAIIPATQGGWSEPALFEWELTEESWTDEHPHSEYNYVIEGHLFVESGGITVEAQAGDVVQVPAGAVGKYWAPKYARLLAIYGPSKGAPSRKLSYQKLSRG